MNALRTEIKYRGKAILVPTCVVEAKEIVSLGRIMRIASLKDEEWRESTPLAEPQRFADALRKNDFPADILAFSGAVGDPVVAPGLAYEMDNVAVIRTSDYAAWWEALPQEARKNTRRAARRGVEIKCVPFDDALIAGIKAIYDETPVRQGRKFWHYGKSIDAVRQDNSSYLDHCEFLGAYYQGELVGFMKYVFVGDTARIMQILCLNAHQDKRPIIALIVKAAERCHQRGVKYLIYGKFVYGQKAESSITEFKRRLGFEQIDFPRYYMPLNIRGRIAIALGLHRGLQAMVPAGILDRLLRIRSAWLSRSNPQKGMDGETSGRSANAPVPSEEVGADK